MPKLRKSKSAKNNRSKAKAHKPSTVPLLDLNRLEFHRQAMALMPAEADADPAIVYWVAETAARTGMLFCSCASNTRSTCKHLKAFSHLQQALEKKLSGQNPAADFEADPWHRFAAIMAEGRRLPLESVRFAIAENGNNELCVHDGSGHILVTYLAPNDGRARLIDRCTLNGGKGKPDTRATVLAKLSSLTLSDNERLLAQKGLKTRRQTFEAGFWHRFAYHCFREFQDRGYVLDTAVKAGKELTLAVRDLEGEALVTIAIPADKTEAVLDVFADQPFAESAPKIGDLPLLTILDVRLDEAGDLVISPKLERQDADGETRYFDLFDLQTSEYQDFYFFEDLQLLLKDRRPLRALPDFIARLPLRVPNEQVPCFLMEHTGDLQSELYRIDQSVKKLKIMTRVDHMEMSPAARERDWYWLSVTYGQGRQSISLEAVLAARESGQRFVAVKEGWVDARAAAFDILDELSTETTAGDDHGHGNAVKLRLADVLRLGAVDRNRITVTQADGHGIPMDRLLSMTPDTPLPGLDGLTSVLRPYQLRGAEWLWFLHENGLGGLLCDDMGLGKTHQVMALLLALKQAGALEKPALVVCPTSVLSHWQRKLADHAPDLKVDIYHGSQRDLERQLPRLHLLVTSYGVLRQDADRLTAIAFPLAVFDEVQHIKNAATLAHKAAQQVNAGMKIGLTGTPIENSVAELKALCDLVVPGYLGPDHRFEQRYRIPIEQHRNEARRSQLRQMISPFTLRRLKKNVLTDLPPKIEDYRFCRLSEEQVGLYRQAVASKGRQLIATLADEKSAVPYIHIFALLNLLKQICNHPALATDNAAAYNDHASGKWDLFTELLSESLDSGQKIVIYSQYLTMIEIITRYLSDQKVDFAVLTGASRNRGRIIRRFNEDPACRVFVGSLKAGGVGIDLVAASVVIHYDRWWNAAKEDQATDRVHRIGQTRGVQVFKLVTQGTLEEKINAVIARKRDLMESIVKEDDPDLVKTFTRKELLQMLAMPEIQDD